MKKMNKVIAAMMIMAITSVPAMASNNVDKKPGKDKDRIEVRVNDKKNNHKKSFHRADIKTVTFKVSKKANHRYAEAKAMSVRGVKSANYNRRSGKITVKYDANKTSVRTIKRAVK
ncbi:MAG: hypothetical protein K5893_01245 [Prevotella sp.]|nr:hypothetical protein [Prevotella sp.]